MKALKPSHREKKRYVLVRGKDANKKNIEEVILEFVGVLGFAEVSPQVIKFEKGSVLMVINRGMLDKVRMSFSISSLDLDIERVSGSVKNLK